MQANSTRSKERTNSCPEVHPGNKTTHPSVLPTGWGGGGGSSGEFPQTRESPSFRTGVTADNLPPAAGKPRPRHRPNFPHRCPGHPGRAARSRPPKKLRGGATAGRLNRPPLPPRPLAPTTGASAAPSQPNGRRNGPATARPPGTPGTRRPAGGASGGVLGQKAGESARGSPPARCSLRLRPRPPPPPLPSRSRDPGHVPPALPIGRAAGRRPPPRPARTQSFPQLGRVPRRCRGSGFSPPPPPPPPAPSPCPGRQREKSFTYCSRSGRKPVPAAPAPAREAPPSGAAAAAAAATTAGGRHRRRPPEKVPGGREEPAKKGNRRQPPQRLRPLPCSGLGSQSSSPPPLRRPPARPLPPSPAR